MAELENIIVYLDAWLYGNIDPKNIIRLITEVVEIVITNTPKTSSKEYKEKVVINVLSMVIDKNEQIVYKYELHELVKSYTSLIDKLLASDKVTRRWCCCFIV